MCIDENYVEQFRDSVLKDFNANISKQEGLWFSSSEYPLYRKLPL